MGLEQIIILSVIVCVIGQMVYSKGRKIFYITHSILLVICVLIGIFFSSNQTGGVSWPWWFFSIIYSIPVVISLGFGSLRAMLN